MRKLTMAMAMVSVLATAGSAGAQGRFLPAPAAGIPGEYLVMLAESSVRGPEELPGAGPSVEETAASLAGKYGGEVIRTYSYGAPGFLVRLDEARARALAAEPSVGSVQQNRRVAAFERPAPGTHLTPRRSGPGSLALVSGGSPQPIDCVDPDPRSPPPEDKCETDPAYDCVDNWGLDRIDQSDAVRDEKYEYSATGSGVHAYVIDTGVRADHEEFWMGCEPGPSRIGTGKNVIAGQTATDLSDNIGHGTHVAAILGGCSSGVAKDVALHPVKFSDIVDGVFVGGTLADVNAAVEWIGTTHDVATMGPAVVNFSGGNGVGNQVPPYNDDPMLIAKIGDLLEDKIAFVQSAGNQNNDVNGTATDACGRSLGGVPELDALIVAGGTDSISLGGGVWLDGRWLREGPNTTGNTRDPSYCGQCLFTGRWDCGSNTGECVDIWAPAAHIISAGKDSASHFFRQSGTSMAAPHVAGAVALNLETAPAGTSAADVQAALVDGATCGALDEDPGSDYFIGDGSPNRYLDTFLRGTGCGPLPADDYLWGPTNYGLSFQVHDLVANDVHPSPGGTVSFNDFESDPQHGYITYLWWNGEDTIYNYIPDLNFSGVDTFTYSVVDQNGLTAEATVFLAIENGIFADAFETEDTSAWTSQATVGGATLAVTQAAALEERFGLAAGLSGAGSLAYVEDSTPSAESRYRARFLVSPAGASMSPGDVVTVFQASQTSVGVTAMVRVRATAAGFEAAGIARRDDGNYVWTSWHPISNGTTNVEIDWKAAKNDGDNDGSLTLWLDGEEVEEIAGLDNDGRRVDLARLGVVHNIAPGSSGVLYFDAFVSRRLTFIGPVG